MRLGLLVFEGFALCINTAWGLGNAASLKQDPSIEGESKILQAFNGLVK